MSPSLHQCWHKCYISVGGGSNVCFGVAHVLNSLMGGTNIVVRVVQMSWLVVLDDSGATCKTFCTSYNQTHFTKTSSRFGSSKASPVTFIL
jgi:hypothetical protein